MSIKKWAYYEPDGRITSVYGGTAQEAEMQDGGGRLRVLLPTNMNNNNSYVNYGQPTLRSDLPLALSTMEIVADGLDEAIISNIPEGVQVEWPDGQTDIVTDGEIRFSVDLPGTYTFRFTAVLYLDQEIIIEAIPAT